jgi:ubiquinone/menaquinone biosynthesis C-methylase UbiE
MLEDHLSAEPPGGRRILDAGCGTGTMVIHLRRYGAVFGVDMDLEAAHYCLEREVRTVAQGKVGELPFADATFDLVTMLDVLEHIPDEASALTDAARVLRPGGLLLLAVPAYMFLWGPQDEVSQHQRRYTDRRIRNVVGAAGLSVRKLTYFNTVLFPFIAGIRVARRALPRPATASSDFNFPAPGPMNGVLAVIFGAEAGVVARTNLPFGVSVLCLAQKAP